VPSLAHRLHPDRLRRTLGAATCVREPARLIANELRDAPRVGVYRLRGSGLTIHVRHPLLDIWVLEEIFRFSAYAPPPEVTSALRALRRPLRVLDLGGNVGLFALYAHTLFPDASIVSFEPDPDNAGVLSRTLRANDLPWLMIEACAATQDGMVEFASSYHLSRSGPVTDDALEAKQERIATALPFLAGTALLKTHHRVLPSRDVFPYAAEADLVKIDIEGAEWEILRDPRFAELDAAAVVLEYHPAYGRGSDGEATVRRALEAAGYSAGPAKQSDDAAVLWAWKP